MYLLVLVLVTPFTLVGLNRLPPMQCSLKKILWDLIEGRVPSPTQKNALFAVEFPQTHWQSDPRQLVVVTDTSWIFTRAPFRRVAALNPWVLDQWTLGGPTGNRSSRRHSSGTARCHRPGTLRRGWTLGQISVGPSIGFQTYFAQAFKIVVDSWKFSMLLLYIL